MLELQTANLPVSTGSRASSYPAPAPAPAPQPSRPGVTPLSNTTYDIFAVPPVLKFTTASDNGVGAAAVTQYIFNNNVMTPAVTTNGSGASSITNTYGDGFTGKIYEQLFRSANGGRGVSVKRFTIQSTTTSTAAQYGTALVTLAMTLKNANVQGGTFDVPIDVTPGINNTMYLAGTLTLEQRFWINSMNQISVYLPANTTYAFTFITEKGGDL